MFQALKFRLASQRQNRPAAICAALLLASFQIVSALATAGPANAEEVTIEPIAKSQPAVQTPEAGQDEHSANSSQAADQPVDTLLEGPEIGPEIAEPPVTIVNDKPAATPAMRESAKAAEEPSTISVEADPLMEAAAESAESHQVESAKSADEPQEATPAATASAPETAGGEHQAAETDAIEFEPTTETAASSQPENKAKEVKVAAVDPQHKTDIFDQWALQKFKHRKEKPPHPLAAAHPDDFVVVCEAGCAEVSPEIVYLERRNARGPVNEKPIKSGVVATSENSIDCVGGCYDGRGSYKAVALMESPASYASRSDGEGWMTTVKKAEQKKAEPKKRRTEVKTRWYDRLN